MLSIGLIYQVILINRQSHYCTVCTVQLCCAWSCQLSHKSTISWLAYVYHATRGVFTVSKSPLSTDERSLKYQVIPIEELCGLSRSLCDRLGGYPGGRGFSSPDWVLYRESASSSQSSCRRFHCRQNTNKNNVYIYTISFLPMCLLCVYFVSVTCLLLVCLLVCLSSCLSAAARCLAIV